jgi:CRP/FNR family transcriptional regulator, cyclic AMP receptor protein
VSASQPHAGVMGSKPTRQTFNAGEFLASSRIATPVVQYRRTETVFSQGDACAAVMYLQKGRVTLTVRSDAGREAVVARLRPGQFFGEGCLAGQAVRTASATATMASTVRVVETATMIRLLRDERGLTDGFIAHVLARNIRIEQDLLDHLFNVESTERRLARTLLVLTEYGTAHTPRTVLPTISQERLAQMVGTTRARVDALMSRFQTLGFITRNGVTQVHSSLVSVVLED